MSAYLSLDEVKKLKTGDRVRVTWSGGNGPHEYQILRSSDGTILCTLQSNLVGFPHIIGALYHSYEKDTAIVMIHKVELIDAKQRNKHTEGSD